MQITCSIGSKPKNYFTLQILLVLLKSKEWAAIAPVWYSTKMQESCIKGPKTYNIFRGKYIWMIVVKAFFINFNCFTKFKSQFQNSYLQLLQVYIRQKCRDRVSKDLNHTIYLEDLWKYIWMIAVKTYFIIINSFTKFMSRFQNSCLQLFQFDILLKWRQRMSQALNHKTHAESLENIFEQ